MEEKRQPLITFDGVSKAYGSHLILKDFSVRLEGPQLCAIVGDSGSGKTTFMRLASGLEAPDSGEIYRTGNQVSWSFQEPRLFPWLKVWQNIALPLENAGVSEKDAKQKVMQILKELQMPQVSNHWPFQLSGGMARRVSLARALILPSELLFLDEPFSELNESMRYDVLEVIRNRIQKNQTLCVCSTHHLPVIEKVIDRKICMNAKQLM